MKRFVLMALMGAAFAPCSDAAENSNEWSIILPGEYHDGEAPLEQPGEGWFALVQKNGIWRLVPETLTVQRVRDEMIDGEGPDVVPTGLKVEGSHTEAMFFLQHPTLRSGVVSAIESDPESVDPNSLPYLFEFDDKGREFEFEGRRYRMRVVRHSPPVLDPNGFQLSYGTYSLIVAIGEKQEIVIDTDEIEDDFMISLRWAGDLDRDGFPDFIISTSGHNSGERCWYLSGAYPDLSYQKLGCHRYTGC